jgi:hypothetical protein
MRGDQFGCAVQCDAEAMQSKSGRGSTTFMHVGTLAALTVYSHVYFSFFLCELVVFRSPVVQSDTEPVRRHAVPSRRGREKREGTPCRVAHDDDDDSRLRKQSNVGRRRRHGLDDICQQQLQHFHASEHEEMKLELRIRDLASRHTRFQGCSQRALFKRGRMENGNFANCHGDGARSDQNKVPLVNYQQITASITEVGRRKQASTSARLVHIVIGSTRG